MDATRLNIPNLNKLKRQLTDASAEHDDGKRYVRASVAARIIGVTPGHQTMWIRACWITPLRFRVPNCRAANNGRVTCWPLDQAITAARRYWTGNRKWRPADDDYLLEKIGRVPLDRLATVMGRSVEAITQRARYHGVNQYNAQGELTPPLVARLCGVSRSCVLRVWCKECDPPLRARRMADAKGTLMISANSLRQFFRDHPEIYARRAENAKRRINAFISAGGRTLKAVAA